MRRSVLAASRADPDRGRGALPRTATGRRRWPADFPVRHRRRRSGTTGPSILKTVLTMTACAVAIALAGAANAADVYVGLTRTTPGEAYADFASAKNVRNYNSPLALKLFGGVQFNEQFGIEGGYGDFGSWKIANPANAASDEVRIKSNVWYLAGTGTLALSERFSVFGKLGLAQNNIEVTNTGAHSVSSLSSLRPMFGFGVEYNITKSVAALLEFERFGTSSAANQSYNQQKLELGLKLRF
jgi:OOP family OmpA-OmpF porin